MTNRLADATWTELATRSRTIIAVPVGSCEQHGPHLPLDTDTRVATAVANGLAARRPDVLVGPPIAISASGEHAGFAGTLSIGVDVLRSVLVELGRSADWSDGVVFVNGHGGNNAAVTSAVELLIGEGRNALSWSPRLTGGDAHAGHTETSVLLHLAASVVRHDAATAGNVQPLGELIGPMRAGGVLAVSANGVLGDPTAAEAAHGEQLIATMVDDLVDRFDVTASSWSARRP